MEELLSNCASPRLSISEDQAAFYTEELLTSKSQPSRKAAIPADITFVFLPSNLP